MIKVLIIDDHEIIHSGIKSKLRSHYPDVELEFGEPALSAREGLALAKSYQPDIIILDIQLPDRYGDEIVEELLSLPHKPKVIAYSAHSEKYPSRVIQAGAQGFVTKSEPMDELLRAFQSVVLYDRPYFSSEISAKLADIYRGGNALARLSKQERVVFDLLVEGYENSEIWEKMNFKYPSQVNTVRRRINEKLGVDTELSKRDQLQAYIRLV